METNILEGAILKLRQNKARCNWIPTYGFVSDFIRKLNAEKVVEIGVAYGYHAEHLLKEHDHVIYIGVDPYEENYDPTDVFSRDVEELFSNYSEKPMDVLHKCVQYNLMEFAKRCFLIRMKSKQASCFIADNSIDIAYIDGDHRPEAVREDLESWFSKIRPGGIICGDDYNWPGTAEVLSNFFLPKGYKIIGYADSKGQVVKWSVEKK
jgi:predicted O-methyltransferase YrrM